MTPTPEQVALFLSGYAHRDVIEGMQIWAKGSHGIERLGWIKQDTRPDKTERREWMQVGNAYYVNDPSKRVIEVDTSGLKKPCPICKLPMTPRSICTTGEDYKNGWRTLWECPHDHEGLPDTQHLFMTRKTLDVIAKELSGTFKHTGKYHDGRKLERKSVPKRKGCQGCGKKGG
jgi:hypothetical protein